MFPSAFDTSDGLRLACHGPQSLTDTLRGQLILVHGLGDHSRSLPYRNLAEHLSVQRFGVYGFDLRGHGQSEGPRMFANTWADLRNDLHMFVDADTIVPPAGSAAFFEQMPGPDKERLTYPGAYHNLFIEPKRDQVFADVVQ